MSWSDLRKRLAGAVWGHLVGDAAGVPYEFIEPQDLLEFRFGDTRHVVSDVSKLQALGWEPTTHLREIVEEYVAWAEAQPGVRDYYEEAEAVMKQMGTVPR